MEAATSAVGRQSAALGALARHDGFARQDRDAILRAIAETAVEVLGVAQAAVWLLKAEGGSLDCVDLYDGRHGRHEGGATLSATDHPAYFDALKEARMIATDDAAADPRTASLAADYLVPRGLTALIDAPVLLHGRFVGVVCCEQVGPARPWSGEDVAFVGSLADFAALALAGDERRRTEERLELAFKATRSAVWDRDARTGEVWRSPEYYAMLGVDPASAAPSEIWESRLHPDEREAIVSRALAQFSDGGEFRQVYRMRRADDTWIWVEDFGHVVRDAEGNPTRYVGIKTDVTERVLRERALREAEERYRSLFENAVEGLWRMGPDGRLEEANPALAEMLGFGSPAELLGGEGGTRALFADGTRWEEIARLIQQQDRIFDHEAELVRQDGQRVWVSLNLRAVRGLDGAIAAVEGSADDVTHLKRAQAQLDHASMHDGLTNLPNRYLFVDRAGQALARQRLGSAAGCGTAVILVDYDDLKLINDSLGHAVGDAMLVELAQRLQGALRPGDTLARLGSDEFAVLADCVADGEMGKRLADALRAAAAPPVTLLGHEVFPSVSVGVAVDTGERQDAEELLRDAGMALHEAKSQGRGRCVVFAPTMRSEPLAVLRLQGDLRRAIEREEFLLHYQPVIDLATRGLIGFEALVRWQHPQRGMLAPNLFIPVAEDAGLMPELGAWVLRQGIAQLAAWQRRLPAGRPFTLSINLAPSQVATPDLFTSLDRLLELTGADVRRLRLEVTETAFDGDADLVALRLRALRERGLSIAIDDFGTGYSSLGRLHRFPIDALKIDQSFVRPMLVDPDSAAIVRSVLALGQALGLGVVAEGVEDEAIARELLRLGCLQAQGYAFARPLPVEAADALVARLAGVEPMAVATG